MSPKKQQKLDLRLYKVLANSAGVRVSPICLGTMNFGTAWNDELGECSKKESFQIMDAFYESGGNFIDTASNYQDGQSEEWIGEWMKDRQNRDEMVIATKYSSLYVKPKDKHTITINYVGNDSKSLHCSVRDSLKKLQTDYIDILYVHWWDYSTSISEMMQSLNRLIASGKVLYLGISDTPAWVVSAANTYAKDHGLAPFVIYQGKWNIAEPEFERDIIPMCRAYGMALAPWSVLLGGKTKTPDQDDAGRGRRELHPTTYRQEQINADVLDAIDMVAEEFNASRQHICIAYILKKNNQAFPILGCRKAIHLVDNLLAFEFVDKLTSEHMATLEAAADFELGFPHDIIGCGKFFDNSIIGWGGEMQELAHPILHL